MKKLVFFLFVLVLLNTVIYAQSEYKTAVGGRIGTPIAGSIKHFISDMGALEGYAGFTGGGVDYYTGINPVIGAMYQHHFPIGDIAGFRWYVGGGALIQFFNEDDNYFRNNPGEPDYSSTGFGLNGVGGVDYKFRNIPLNLSADWMPTFFLNKNHYSSNVRGGYGGIAARYTFR
jgi:hypothetical protein